MALDQCQDFPDQAFNSCYKKSNTNLSNTINGENMILNASVNIDYCLPNALPAFSAKKKNEISEQIVDGFTYLLNCFETLPYKIIVESLTLVFKDAKSHFSCVSKKNILCSLNNYNIVAESGDLLKLNKPISSTKIISIEEHEKTLIFIVCVVLMKTKIHYSKIVSELKKNSNQTLCKLSAASQYKFFKENNIFSIDDDGFVTFSQVLKAVQIENSVCQVSSECSKSIKSDSSKSSESNICKETNTVTSPQSSMILKNDSSKLIDKSICKQENTTLNADCSKSLKSVILKTFDANICSERNIINTECSNDFKSDTSEVFNTNVCKEKTTQSSKCLKNYSSSLFDTIAVSKQKYTINIGDSGKVTNFFCDILLASGAVHFQKLQILLSSSNDMFKDYFSYFTVGMILNFFKDRPQYFRIDNGLISLTDDYLQSKLSDVGIIENVSHRTDRSPDMGPKSLNNFDVQTNLKCQDLSLLGYDSETLKPTRKILHAIRKTFEPKSDIFDMKENPSLVADTISKTNKSSVPNQDNEVQANKVDDDVICYFVEILKMFESIHYEQLGYFLVASGKKFCSFFSTFTKSQMLDFFFKKSCFKVSQNGYVSLEVDTPLKSYQKSNNLALSKSDSSILTPASKITHMVAKTCKSKSENIEIKEKPPQFHSLNSTQVTENNSTSELNNNKDSNFPLQTKKICQVPNILEDNEFPVKDMQESSTIAKNMNAERREHNSVVAVGTDFHCTPKFSSESLQMRAIDLILVIFSTINVNNMTLTRLKSYMTVAPNDINNFFATNYPETDIKLFFSEKSEYFKITKKKKISLTEIAMNKISSRDLVFYKSNISYGNEDQIDINQLCSQILHIRTQEIEQKTNDLFISHCVKVGTKKCHFDDVMTFMMSAPDDVKQYVTSQFLKLPNFLEQFFGRYPNLYVTNGLHVTLKAVKQKDILKKQLEDEKNLQKPLLMATNWRIGMEEKTEKKAFANIFDTSKSSEIRNTDLKTSESVNAIKATPSKTSISNTHLSNFQHEIKQNLMCSEPYNLNAEKGTSNVSKLSTSLTMEESFDPIEYSTTFTDKDFEQRVTVKGCPQEEYQNNQLKVKKLEKQIAMSTNWRKQLEEEEFSNFVDTYKDASKIQNVDKKEIISKTSNIETVETSKTPISNASFPIFQSVRCETEQNLMISDPCNTNSQEATKLFKESLIIEGKSNDIKFSNSLIDNNFGDQFLSSKSKEMTYYDIEGKHNVSKHLSENNLFAEEKSKLDNKFPETFFQTETVVTNNVISSIHRNSEKGTVDILSATNSTESLPSSRSSSSMNCISEDSSFESSHSLKYDNSSQLMTEIMYQEPKLLKDIKDVECLTISKDVNAESAVQDSVKAVGKKKFHCARHFPEDVVMKAIDFILFVFVSVGANEMIIYKLQRYITVAPNDIKDFFTTNYRGKKFTFFFSKSEFFYIAKQKIHLKKAAYKKIYSCDLVFYKSDYENEDQLNQLGNLCPQLLHIKTQEMEQKTIDFFLLYFLKKGMKKTRLDMVIRFLKFAHDDIKQYVSSKFLQFPNFFETFFNKYPNLFRINGLQITLKVVNQEKILKKLKIKEDTLFMAKKEKKNEKIAFSNIPDASKIVAQIQNMDTKQDFSKSGDNINVTSSQTSMPNAAPPKFLMEDITNSIKLSEILVNEDQPLTSKSNEATCVSEEMHNGAKHVSENNLLKEKLSSFNESPETFIVKEAEVVDNVTSNVNIYKNLASGSVNMPTVTNLTESLSFASRSSSSMSYFSEDSCYKSSIPTSDLYPHEEDFNKSLIKMLSQLHFELISAKKCVQSLMHTKESVSNSIDSHIQAYLNELAIHNKDKIKFDQNLEKRVVNFFSIVLRMYKVSVPLDFLLSHLPTASQEVQIYYSSCYFEDYMSFFKKHAALFNVNELQMITLISYDFKV